MGKLLKIIIIDSSLRIVRRLTQELERQNLEFVACVVETQEALVASLTSSRPDIFLFVIDASAMDGFVSLDVVRQHHTEVPFIFVSQIYSPGLIVEIFENGGNGLIPLNQLPNLRNLIAQAQTGPQERLESVDGADCDVYHPQPQNLPPNTPDQGIAKFICPRCKRICDRDGDWQTVAIHLRLYRQATVKLGTCPDCAHALASP